MGRSDDSITRRKNKRARNKQDGKNDSSSKVSTRVASIIAFKKRRLAGKRRLCQGMCYSLPTPEDPFNDRKGKPELTNKRKKQKANGRKKPKVQKNAEIEGLPDNGRAVSEDTEFLDVMRSKGDEISVPIPCKDFTGPQVVLNFGKSRGQILKLDESSQSWNLSKNDHVGHMVLPPKSVAIFLSSVLNAVDDDERLIHGSKKSLITDRWGLDFLSCYYRGKDIFENVENFTNQQIAWLASAAAEEATSMQKKDGKSFNAPFLLFLVPSQDRAYKVRRVCKPLKALGVHSVSLHPGATVDHQLNGLRSCKPDILISTPERLLELLSLKAVDLSGVSLLAVEGLVSAFGGSYTESIKSIRNLVPQNARVVVFCQWESSLAISSFEDFTKRPVHGCVRPCDNASI